MIQNFINYWQDKGDELSDTQTFWLALLHDVFGVNDTKTFIEFQKRVQLEHISYIDAYITTTRIVIEQKSLHVNLDTPAKQSDGTLATPFEQAQRYRNSLPHSEQGRYIVVCNFKEFRVYDLNYPHDKPEVILLRDLKREYHKLKFLVDANARSPKEIKEVALSVEAGTLIGKLYEALLKQYTNPDDETSRESLNVFCVRLVFLLYAEDAGLFSKGQFHDYLKDRQATPREALHKLFRVLNQKLEHRDPYIEPVLDSFPYVNGGLFADNTIPLPQLDTEALHIILDEMSLFNWAGISPTIFGAVFESTINPKTRQEGGMHYTSIQNIHMVIDPLFLDALTQEADTLLALKPSGVRTRKLRTFQKKLASLQFFDPACGSGNFLTESYLSIRRLENRIIAELVGPQITFAFSKKETPIQVSISQFFGIEINDFAVAVARTALWIAEAQMWSETKNIMHLYEDFLPLKSEAHILQANALRTDWHTVVTPSDKLYIMGNPPYLGYSMQTKEQKQDIFTVFRDEDGKPYKATKNIDYVAGWYYKASEFMAGTATKTAFVSTNSITQGEQVGYIFKPLYERFRIDIKFAWHAFVWNSEAKDKAHVHVVVIGFDTVQDNTPRRLYTPEGLTLADNINFYLLPAPNAFTENRQTPISTDAPKMMGGNMPADGGNLIIEAEEYADFIKRDPKATKYIKRYMMGQEFINGIVRYCLWLVGATPQELHDMPMVRERVRLCRQLRLKSSQPKLADTPHLFRERLNPKRYIAIPQTSSEKRHYIPIGWLDDSVIPGSGGLMIIPDATLYHFGVLTSRVHMAWVRVVTGRLKSDYRYSKQIDYNCFVWPNPTPKQKNMIEHTAQGILDARAKHPESTLAALYDDATMPVDLRKAHRENDAAVCEAYGWAVDVSEADIVARLFALYQASTF